MMANPGQPSGALTVREYRVVAGVADKVRRAFHLRPIGTIMITNELGCGSHLPGNSEEMWWRFRYDRHSRRKARGQAHLIRVKLY